MRAAGSRIEGEYSGSLALTLGSGEGYKRTMESRELSPELSDEDRVLLVFAYLGPLALFTLLASRKEFVKWHAKQGIVVSTATVGLYLAFRAVHIVLTKIAWPVIGDLFWIAVGFVGLGLILVTLLCIVRALDGERFRVPILGDLADQF